jgi:thiamine pyrophosphate-dependent acetolactate synthase large subunit-like protein
VAAREHLQADARPGVEALIAAVESRSAQWHTGALQRLIRDLPAESAQFPADPGIHYPRDVVSALDAAIPQDWELENSSGHRSYYFAQMPSRTEDRFLTIREFGAIGNGTSFTMGVCAARPQSTVVLVDGDGSLLMHVQEIETMPRHGMQILIVILNDGAYGSEIHKLRAEGLDDAGAVFGRTDLAAVARDSVRTPIEKPTESSPDKNSPTMQCNGMIMSVRRKLQTLLLVDILLIEIRKGIPKFHVNTEIPGEFTHYHWAGTRWQ